MKPCIIGIAGKANSGKDTIASMINYITTVGTTKAKYADWITKRLSNDAIHGNRIIHFADNLKDVISIIFNIPRELFDDRKYKDGMYYNIARKYFIDEKDIKSSHIIITIDDLKKHSLSYYIESNINKLKTDMIYIKLRTLLQYIGNEIGREQLSDNIWIDGIIRKAKDIAGKENVCIIPDVRYENEANAISNNGFLYGGLIKVIRDGNTEVTDTNIESERINFNCDYFIYNKSTLTNTFYQVLNICQQINELNN